jgi:hypothetical protein
MKLDHWFYYSLPGETIQNSKTHGSSSNFNKPPTSVNCTRSNIICMSKTSCKRVGKSRAKTKRHRVAGGKKCQPKKVKPQRSTSSANHEARSDFFLGAQGRKLHLKVPLGERENAVKCWSTKFGDKISRNRLRKQKNSEIFVTKGTIRLENARALGAGKSSSLQNGSELNYWKNL